MYEENSATISEQLAPLVEVAHHLAMNFEAGGPHYCYLRRPNSIALVAHHHTDPRNNKRTYFTFSLTEIRDTTRNTGTSITPKQAMHYDEERNGVWTTSINIGADKTTEQIARELERRLITPCLPLWERMTERFNQWMHNKLSTERLKPRIEAVIRSVPDYKVRLRTFAVYESGESINVELTCTLPQLEKIAAVFNNKE